MGTPLRVLIVEDVEDDALLMVRHLRNAGYEPNWTRVETRNELDAALAWQDWDVVLADYTLPHFSAPAALQAVQQSGLDIPFIVVTGTVGEDVAVEMMKAGAHDYLLKASLTRLPAAVSRELHEAIERRSRRRAEETIKVLAKLPAESPHPILRVDRDGKILYANPASAPLVTLWRSAPGQTVPESWQQTIAETLHTREHQELEFEHGGKTYFMTVVPIPSEQYVNLYGKDITLRKQAELALRHSEAWFRSLIENASDIVFVTNTDGTMVYASPSVTRALGHIPAHLLGATPYDLVHPEDCPKVLEGLAKVLHAIGTVEQVECRVRRADGQWAILAFTGQAMVDPSGVTKVVLNAHDITERVQRQRKLEESEAKTIAIMQAAQDAIILLDEQGRIAYWNPAAERLFGCASQEASGKAIHGWLVPERYRRDAARGLQHFQETGGGPVIGKVLELMALRPNGAEFPIELSVGAFQWQGARHAVGILRDITERKKTENAIKESRDLLSAIVTSAPVGIVAIDQNEHVTQWNPAAERIFGWTQDEMVGRSVFSLVPDTLRDEIHAHTSRALRSEILTNLETHSLRKDGLLLKVSYSLAPYHDAAGNILGVIGIVLDVTEQHRLQEQARRLDYMALLGQLLAGITHEIKNPLFVLTGSLQLLKERLANKEYLDLPRDLDRIGKAAGQIEQTVQRFLTLARPVPPAHMACSVEAVLRQTVELLRHECLKNQIHVETAMGQNLPSIQTDPRLLQEVFLNLMMNAVQAMHAAHGQGTLFVSATEVTGPDGGDQSKSVPWIEVKITDDGPGIAPEHRTKLFTPFFSTKPPGQGTGLGLWIVHSNLNALGGTATCETEVGKGATFIVHLPVIQPPPPHKC